MRCSNSAMLSVKSLNCWWRRAMSPISSPASRRTASVPKHHVSRSPRVVVRSSSQSRTMASASASIVSASIAKSSLDLSPITAASNMFWNLAVSCSTVVSILSRLLVLPRAKARRRTK